MILNIDFLVSVVITTATLVAANGGGGSPPTDISQCDLNQAFCCSAVYQDSDPLLQYLAALVGAEVAVDDLLSGFECSPIANVLSASCDATPACCSGNSYAGLINVGCNTVAL